MKKLIRTLLVTLALTVCVNTGILNWQMLRVENQVGWTNVRVDADERAIIVLADWVRPASGMLEKQLLSTVRVEIFTGRFDVLSGQVERALGSGVIINSSGVILTAKHVAQAFLSPKACGGVYLYNGTLLTIKKVVLDPVYDVALLQVDPNGVDLQAAHFGGMPDVGDPIWVIGNPLGLYFVVSHGVVSTTQTPDEVGRTILTDAAMNPGNSGGPLFDRGGRIIGIAQGVLSPGPFSVGLNYAVGIDVITSRYCDLHKELTK